jgi:hypothetical protein
MCGDANPSFAIPQLFYLHPCNDQLEHIHILSTQLHLLQHFGIAPSTNSLLKNMPTITKITIVSGEYFLKAKPSFKIWMARLVTKKLKPEDKVNLSINMTDVCTRICADAVRDQDKTIKEEEIMELVRKRIMYKKRHHHEV